jgi:hypothetical protein
MAVMGIYMKSVSILLVSFVLVPFCSAETWVVDRNGKADFISIQEAIHFSSNGDFIIVHEGVYEEQIDFLGKEITVEGASRESTIINGNGMLGSVVTFKTGETNSSVLSKFTITGGTGNFWTDPVFGQQRCGGGIYCENSSPFIQLCDVIKNTSWGGAGIFATNGSPSIFFSSVTYNYAEGHGGGAYLVDQVHSDIDSCIFAENTASWGGGLSCSTTSDPLILNCIFDRNTTMNVGGGMFIRSQSSPIVMASEFTDNTQISNPLGSGGGVCIYGGGSTGGPCYPTFQFCAFEGNSVQGDGGGMAAAYDAHPKILDCHFAFNQAGRSGGGLACVADQDHIYPSNADVDDVSFEFNHADEEGGGIHVRNSDPFLDHVEVHSNEAGIAGGGLNFFESSLSRVLNSVICGNSEIQINGTYSDGGNNTISDMCSSCEGDVNEDGQVNVTDVLAVVGTWGPCTGDCNGDIDGSGVVDVTDLLIIVGNWGPC